MATGDFDDAGLLKKLEAYAEIYPTIRERLKIIRQSSDPAIQAKVKLLRELFARRDQNVIERLTRAFNLTRAEARLALWLAEGGSIAEYAQSAGISLGTARTHLKAVFAKTGAHRQSALASLVLRQARSTGG